MGKYSAARDLDLNTKARWFVVANRTRAVIYEDDTDHKFKFIERLNNSQGEKMESELDSDKPGRGFSSASRGIHHAMDKRFNKHEDSARKFAKRIAEQICVAHREKKFRDIVLVAEPHFLGLLRGALDSSVLPTIAHEVHREYAQGSDAEVRKNILAAIAEGK